MDNKKRKFEPNSGEITIFDILNDHSELNKTLQLAYFLRNNPATLSQETIEILHTSKRQFMINLILYLKEITERFIPGELKFDLNTEDSENGFFLVSIIPTSTISYENICAIEDDGKRNKVILKNADLVNIFYKKYDIYILEIQKYINLLSIKLKEYGFDLNFNLDYNDDFTLEIEFN